MRRAVLAFTFAFSPPCMIPQLPSSSFDGGCQSSAGGYSGYGHGEGGGGGGDDGGAGSGGPVTGGDGGVGPAPPTEVTLTATAPSNPAYPGGIFTTRLCEIATGGTADLALSVPDANLNAVPFMEAYDAVSDDEDVLAVVSRAGPIVTVRGGTASDTAATIAIGTSNDDAVGDGDYSVAPIASVHAAPRTEGVTDPSGVSATHIVYPVGSPQLSIALLSGDASPLRLIDTSLIVTGATQTGWDTLQLADASAGHHAVFVTTGDGRVSDLDIEVVDGPDHMAILENDGTALCLGAFAQDAFVAGLAWTYTLNGATYQPEPYYGPNCVSKRLIPDGSQLTATAGGVSITVPVP